MCNMPEPDPKEFREDVIRVARNREPGVHLKQIAADFGRWPAPSTTAAPLLELPSVG